MERLTINLIRNHFWNPVTKTCKPIKFFSEQCYECSEDEDSAIINEEDWWITVTFTGNLIQRKDDTKDLIVKNWLSSKKEGPYNTKGSNRYTLYYLETKEEMGNEEKSLQIAWNGEDSNLPNNYLTEDVSGIDDCWVSKKWLSENKIC